MKSLNRLMLFTVVFFLSIKGMTKAHATDLSFWESAVVKVASSPCALGAPRFEGSGLLLQSLGKLYVLTSEHVLIHDTSSRNCIHITNGSIGSLPGKLIRADYFNGLALISVDPSPELFTLAVDWKRLQSQSAGSTLSAMGFPFGSDQLQTLLQGSLVSDQSHRALVPGIKRFIEASSLPVEFGMSGGILLSGTEFAGVVSHQYLKREPGQATTIGNISDSAVRPGDLAIAIPSSEVVNWLQKQFNIDSNEPSLWIRNPESQIKGREEVCDGVLCFLITEKNASDIVGIGGTSGGGDGGGVGGSPEPGQSDPHFDSTIKEKIKVTSVRLKPTATSEERAKPFADPTLEDLRQSLLRGRQVYVGFLKQVQSRRLVKFGSLDQFFTLWLRDRLVPVFMKSRNGDMQSDNAKLIETCRSVERQAQTAKDQASDGSERAWFSTLRDEAILAENRLATASDLEALLAGTNDVFWNRFYEEKFEDAVRLESAIRQLIVLLK